jgi:DnaK suppressor protein
MPHAHAATEIERDAFRVLTARKAELLREGVDDKEVDAALHRLQTASYGDCASCGGAVGRARLRAIPEALQCVGCRGFPLRAVTTRADRLS